MLILTIFFGLGKLLFYVMFFIVIALALVYFFQNRLLYIPDAPNQAFRYPENNPPMYRNPAERSMLYEDVTVNTADKFELKGWFIKQKNPL